MNGLNFTNYILGFSILGFLLLVIVQSDHTIFRTMRMMAAFLCGIVLGAGIGLWLWPRFPDPISGETVEVALATRFLMLLFGLSGVWMYAYT